MWRSRYEEDWERRKQYLIRSLFEEVPPLSPVPEEDESFDSRRTTTSPRPYIPRSTSRPHSPLPPLIIEREPNRHDEPEEFYRKLEKKILKVYRRLFIEGQSDISSDTSDEEVIEAGVDSTEMEVWKGMEKQSLGVDNDDLQNIDVNVEMSEISNADVDEEQNSFRENDSHLNTESSFESDKQNSFETNDNSHNEVFIETNEKNNSGQAGRLIDNDNKSNESIDEDDESQCTDETVEVEKQGRKRTISDQDNNDASESKKSKSFDDGSSSEVLPESVEEENSNNDDLVANIDPNDFRDHRIVQVEADIHRNGDEETPHAVPSAVANAFEDVDDNVVAVMLEENRVPDSLSSSGCKRSWSSVSEESINYEDAGTQTQCGHGRVNRDILRDIFVGPSKVFRICSCVNHICVC